MSVIVELSLPPEAFDVGRILGVDGESRAVLESIVPLGNKGIPLVRVFGGRDSFESEVLSHDHVQDMRIISDHDDEEILYAMDWDISGDRFIQGVNELGGTLLDATGYESEWNVQLLFDDHDGLSAFQEYCEAEDIPIEVKRIFNPTRPEAGPWYGLTPPQRTALVRAVEEGYYAIPRETSTVALADSFDISDQALTERLRRAIVNLVSNTLLLSAPAEETVENR